MSLCTTLEHCVRVRYANEVDNPAQDALVAHIVALFGRVEPYDTPLTRCLVYPAQAEMRCQWVTSQPQIETIELTLRLDQTKNTLDIFVAVFDDNARLTASAYCPTRDAMHMLLALLLDDTVHCPQR